LGLENRKVDFIATHIVQYDGVKTELSSLCIPSHAHSYTLFPSPFQTIRVLLLKNYFELFCNKETLYLKTNHRKKKKKLWTTETKAFLKLISEWREHT
jgi:hypothetical protein